MAIGAARPFFTYQFLLGGGLRGKVLQMGGGHWGVGQACECRSILETIATLIEAHRPDLAMVLIEQELNSQT